MDWSDWLQWMQPYNQAFGIDLEQLGMEYRWATSVLLRLGLTFVPSAVALPETEKPKLSFAVLKQGFEWISSDNGFKDITRAIPVIRQEGFQEHILSRIIEYGIYDWDWFLDGVGSLYNDTLKDASKWESREDAEQFKREYASRPFPVWGELFLVMNEPEKEKFTFDEINEMSSQTNSMRLSNNFVQGVKLGIRVRDDSDYVRVDLIANNLAVILLQKLNLTLTAEEMDELSDKPSHSSSWPASIRDAADELGIANKMEPYRALIKLHNDYFLQAFPDEWEDNFWKSFSPAPSFAADFASMFAEEPVEQPETDIDAEYIFWIKQKMADPWARIWLSSSLLFADPLPHVRWIMAFNNGWFKYDPSLFLAFYPEREQEVTELWQKYGDAMNVLTELSTAFRGWLTVDSWISDQIFGKPPYPPAEIGPDDPEWWNVCERLAGRLLDAERADHILDQLRDLRQGAKLPKQVPAAIVVDSQLPEPPTSESWSEMRLWSTSTIILASQDGVRDALWWLQVYDMWWDAQCSLFRGQALGEIIERGIPQQVQLQTNISDQALENALQLFARVHNQRAGLDHIRRQKQLTANLRREVANKYKAFLKYGSNANWIRNLNDTVAQGVKTPAQADQELRTRIAEFDQLSGVI